MFLHRFLISFREKQDLENDGLNERSFYGFNDENEADIKTRAQDLKNRIELRRMLSEYTSGALKPPIFYQHDIIDVDSAYDNEPSVDQEPVFLPRQLPLDTQRLNEKRFGHAASQFLGNDNEFGQLDRAINEPNNIPLRSIKSNKVSVESGVYTEGGLVLVPNSKAAQQKDCMFCPLEL